MTNYATTSIYNFAMDIIYIDRLFIINLITDYLLVLCSARVCGIVLKRSRYIASAFFGASFAALSILPEFEFLLLAPIKLCSGVLMALIAYGGEKKLLRCCLVFFSISMLFGGAVWAVSLRSGGSIGSYTVMPVSFPVLVLSFSFVYALLSLVFRRTMKSCDKCVTNVTLEHNGSTVKLRTLCDSGNSLFDPITGSSILICPPDKASVLFPEYSDAFRTADASGIVCLDTASSFRLIPYSSVGNASGMLPAFRPEHITIDGQPRNDILVAVSPTDTGGDGFDSIL